MRPVDSTENTDSDDDDLLATIKTWYKDSGEHLKEWYKEAAEDYDFVAGTQWDEEDADVLREDDRPVITFNRCGPVIDSVAGTEINNRQEVSFIPRQVGNSGVNEMYTGANKWIRDESDAEDEESDAFGDVSICGMGWGDTSLNYENDPEGTIVIERIDPLEMRYDKSAKKKNLTDSRYRIQTMKDVDIDDAIAQFPGFDEADLDASWADTDKEDDDEPYEVPLPQNRYKQGRPETDGPKAKRKITQVRIQYWKREFYYVVADPQTGTKQQLSESDFITANARYQQIAGTELQNVKLSRKVYYQAYVGSVILENKPLIYPDGFTMLCMTGKRDRNKNTFYGLVRAMKDPQRWANKWLSQILFIINSNAKGGLMAEADAFVNPRKAKEEWGKPNSITLLKAGGLGKIQEKNPINYPQGLDTLMNFAVSSIRDVTGVNLEMLGMADRDQAGVLESQRKKTAVTILAPLFDSLRRYRKAQGKLSLYLIQNYLSDGRLVQINGPEGKQYIPLMRDPTTTKFDVIVDDAPSAPNQKEQVWGVVQQMLPVVGGMMSPQMWAEVVRYSPLPDSLSQKFVQLIQQQAQASQQPDPMIDLNRQAVQAEVEKDKSIAALNISKAGAANVQALSQAVNFMGGYGPPPTAPMGPNPQAIQTTADGLHRLAQATHIAPVQTANAVSALSQ